MRKQLGLLAALAISSAVFETTRPKKAIEPESEELKKKRYNQQQMNLNSLKGLFEFNYGEGKSVWARNQKNADRKAKNRGWI